MPLPADPGLSLRVTGALDQLAGARARISSGQLEPGLAQARELLGRARELGWAPLEAEALFVIGSHRADLDLDLAGELETLHEAAIAALRGHHDHLAVRSWARLARGLVRVGSLTEAERWLGYAEALAGSLTLAYGEDLPLAADLLHARARLRFVQGDYPGAEQHARERVALLREFYGDDNPRVADGLNNLGVAVYMQYRKDEAVQAYRSALTILERVHGPEHPQVANMHNNIGVVSTDRHAYADALAHYSRAVEIRQRVYPPDHELVMQSRINRANVYLFADDSVAGLADALEVVLRQEHQLESRLALARQAQASALQLADLRVLMVPDLLRLARLFAGAGEHHNALIVFTRALSFVDDIPATRLPPGFEQPPEGDPWPPHLDGCRADLLMGIEDANRALGRERDAERAHAARSPIPVDQPSFLRRCIDEHARWVAARAQ